MAIWLVDKKNDNKNKNKEKINLRKTLSNPAVKRTETNHRQSARQDAIPVDFTQLSHSGKNTSGNFLFWGGSILAWIHTQVWSHSGIYLEVSLQKISQPSKGEFL